MKLINEIVELLEAQTDDNAYVNPGNKAIQDFLKFNPFSKKNLNNSNISKRLDLDGKSKLEYPKTEPSESISDSHINFSELSIEELQKQTLICQKCSLYKSRENVVFGEGNLNADLMFIGEAPGKDEDLQGKPFVGLSGQLLTKMIKAMGYDREEVYIANIIKCRPPYNRNPNPDEVAFCLKYLNRQIELIKPKVLVLLGAVPLHFLLGLNGIKRLHGQWENYNGIKVMPTFHPAFLLRDPKQKRPAWEDLQKVMKYITS